MHVHNDDFRVDLLQKLVGHAKRIIVRCHEHASLQINDGIRHFAFHAFIDAGSGHVRRKIRRPQHAACQPMPVSLDHLEIINNLAFIPDVIPGRDHIDIQFEQFLRECWCDTETRRRILAVGDDQINAMLAHNLRQTVLDDGPSRPTEDVANEKNAHTIWQNSMVTRAARNVPGQLSPSGTAAIARPERSRRGLSIERSSAIGSTNRIFESWLRQRRQVRVLQHHCSGIEHFLIEGESANTTTRGFPPGDA